MGMRASMAGAAFANANAANGLDLDDSARYAYGHAGAQIFPAALAVAEALDRSGAELLTALVVGYEIAHRIGRCWHASRDVYQACGSWGSVACASVAANLMRLTPEQAGHALGIAEYHAGNLPMMRDVDDPGMVKHGIGWGALTGVTAAGLAARGYTGIPTLLAFPEYQAWATDIGQNYLMAEGVAWKPARYACCGWAHAGVEGARRLVQEHVIILDDIARIVVAGSKSTVRLGTRSRPPPRKPNSTRRGRWPRCWWTARSAQGRCWMSDSPTLRFVSWPQRSRWSRTRKWSGCAGSSSRATRAAASPAPSPSRCRMAASSIPVSLTAGCASPNRAGTRCAWRRSFAGQPGLCWTSQRIEALAEMLWRFEMIPTVRDLFGVLELKNATDLTRIRTDLSYWIRENPCLSAAKSPYLSVNRKYAETSR